MTLFLVLVLLLFPVAAGAGVPTTLVSTAVERKELMLTLYNTGPASLTDNRMVDLGRGETRIVLQDLAGQITSGSFFVTLPAGKGSIVEQSVQPANLGRQLIANRYLGKTVQAVRTNPYTGEDSSESAVLLGVDDGYVLQFEDRLETGFPGRLVFPALPAGLSGKNSARITALSELGGPTELTVNYMAEMMNWQADYIGVIGEDDASLSLSGWALVSNSSTESFDRARARFIAGNPRRNPQPSVPRQQYMEAGFDMKLNTTAMAAENFSDYYLYRLDRPFAIQAGEQKRFALFAERRVPLSLEYVLMPEYYQARPPAADEVMKKPVDVYVQLENTVANQLGFPMPGGQVRFFKKDDSGMSLFAGEDRFAPASDGETIRCGLGQSFDVKAQRQQTSFVLLASENRDGYAYESTRRVNLINNGKKRVVVKVIEQMAGDWQILEENLAHGAQSAGQVDWRVVVEPGKQAGLEYRVRIKER